jgi:hypothetical protein
MNPLRVLREAIKAVPAVKFALAVAGVAAVVAIVLGFRLKPEVAVFGTLIVIGLMFVLVVFSRYAGEQNATFVGPAVVLVWFYTLAVIVTTTLFITSYFIHWPHSFTPSASNQENRDVKNSSKLDVSLTDIGPISYGRSSMSFQDGFSTFTVSDYGLIMHLAVKNVGDEPGSLVSGTITLASDGKNIAQGKLFIRDEVRVVKPGGFQDIRVDARFDSYDSSIFPTVLHFSKAKPLSPVTISGGNIRVRMHNFDDTEQEQTLMLSKRDLEFVQ